MGCTCPVDAWRARDGASDGRLKFSPLKGGEHLRISCGRCISCRIARAEKLATQCYCEAQMHESNYFLTLTYSDEHLPSDWSLRISELQSALKRLRYYLDCSFRYLGTGEYGGLYHRPHYHLLGFGMSIPDLYPWEKSPTGGTLYRSPLVEKAWPYGHVKVGAFTWNTAAYVARYSLKKVSKEARLDEYTRFNPATGEVWEVAPVFKVQSLRPGLGYSWFQKYRGDCFPSDFLIVDGRKRAVPDYFLRLADPELALEVKDQRRFQVERDPVERGDRRLMTKHEHARLRQQHFRRDLDGAS